ncbi:FAS1 domain-containing protein [Escovopsis weberi]|uniref:FAS1 domain-containing protein n=1 Tax=Escovopsis weberi TaxID=150374 RepID=A0A0M8N7J6_ESCWE|nr:FAS1 domain-containing protein [Escovopsis weberi]
MRASSILSSLPIALLSIPSVAAYPPPAQIPLPPIAMPSPPKPVDTHTHIPPQVQHSVSLADILGTHRALTTFFALSRQTRALEDLLAASAASSPPAADSTNDRYAAALAAGTAVVVLAPPNAAVERMPRKPWESPADYAAHGASAYAGPGGRARADDNVRRFVEAHVVAVPGAASEGAAAGMGDGAAGWAEGVRAETLVGRAVWWETRDGARVVMPDAVEVERVASRVSNGELWILKGVLDDAA